MIKLKKKLISNDNFLKKILISNDKIKKKMLEKKTHLIQHVLTWSTCHL